MKKRMYLLHKKIFAVTLLIMLLVKMNATIVLAITEHRNVLVIVPSEITTRQGEPTLIRVGVMLDNGTPLNDGKVEYYIVTPAGLKLIGVSEVVAGTSMLNYTFNYRQGEYELLIRYGSVEKRTKLIVEENIAIAVVAAKLLLPIVIDIALDLLIKGELPLVGRVWPGLVGLLAPHLARILDIPEEEARRWLERVYNTKEKVEFTLNFVNVIKNPKVLKALPKSLENAIMADRARLVRNLAKNGLYKGPIPSAQSIGAYTRWAKEYALMAVKYGAPDFIWSVANLKELLGDNLITWLTAQAIDISSEGIHRLRSAINNLVDASFKHWMVDGFLTGEYIGEASGNVVDPRIGWWTYIFLTEKYEHLRLDICVNASISDVGWIHITDEAGKHISFHVIDINPSDSNTTITIWVNDPPVGKIKVYFDPIDSVKNKAIVVLPTYLSSLEINPLYNGIDLKDISTHSIVVRNYGERPVSVQMEIEASTNRESSWEYFVVNRELTVLPYSANCTEIKVRPGVDTEYGDYIVLKVRALFNDSRLYERKVIVLINPEETIKKALKWLLEHQNNELNGISPDDPIYGSWNFTGGGFRGPSVGLTALAVLAFELFASYDDPALMAGLRYILSNARDDGGIYDRYPVYDTSLALIALEHVYWVKTMDGASGGLFGSITASELRAIIQNAVSYLVSAQNDEQEGFTAEDPYYGGWPYVRWMRWADLSNTQFAILALWQARELGFEVPDVVFQKAQIFVTRCQNLKATNPSYSLFDDGGFMYQPASTIWAYGKSYGSMTAAGIWSLFLSGVSETDIRLIKALEWIKNNYSINPLDAHNPPIGKTWLYYYLYTLAKALVILHKDFIDGYNWYKGMALFLSNTQLEDGSWPSYFYEESTEVATVFATLALLSKMPTIGSRLDFEVRSPVRLLIVDSFGRKAGTDATGDIYQEIPGSQVISGSHVVLLDPDKVTYKVYLIGEDSGSYTFTATLTVFLHTTFGDLDYEVRLMNVSGEIKGGDTKSLVVTLASINTLVDVYTSVTSPSYPTEVFIEVSPGSSTSVDITFGETNGLAGYSVVIENVTDPIYSKAAERNLPGPRLEDALISLKHNRLYVRPGGSNATTINVTIPSNAFMGMYTTFIKGKIIFDRGSRDITIVMRIAVLKAGLIATSEYVRSGYHLLSINGVDVVINAFREGSWILIGNYTIPVAPGLMGVRYIDIQLYKPENIESMTLKVYYNDHQLGTTNERALRAFYLIGNRWELCSNQTLDTENNYVLIHVSNKTLPSLEQLQGTPLAVGIPRAVGGKISEVEYSNSAILVIVVTIIVMALFSGVIRSVEKNKGHQV